MNFNWRTWLIAACVSALMAACGGGSNQIVPNFGAVTVTLSGGTQPVAAGTTTTITGNAVTLSTRLSTISWSVATPAGATAAVLSNANCGSANEVTTPSTAASGSTPATGSSVWSCQLSITVPAKLTSTTTYVATFTATDELGTTQSASQSIVFNPATASAGQQLVANVGGAFATTPSSTAPLHCAVDGGTAPYTYAWSIPNNGGQATSLSSYTTADTTLTAPAAPAQIAVECQVADANGLTGSAVVNVTVQKSATSTSMTASAGPTFSVTSGSNVPLQCSTEGASGTVNYSWSIVSNAGLALSLTNLNSQVASFVAPTVTTATPITARCSAVDASNATASADVVVTINPNTAVTPLTAFAGSDFSVAGGGETPLHCDASGGTGPYSFQWVISNSSGLALSLSQYSAADTELSTPVPAADTPVALTCRATDNTQTTATSTVNVNVTAAATSNATLVASLNSAAVVAPGQVVTLNSGTTGWYTNAGLATTGPTISYAWSSTYAGLVFSNAMSSTPSFVVPISISTATQIPVTLTVTSGGQTATATTVYTVDPNGVISLAVNPPATEGKLSSGAAYSFAATATYAGATRNLYYQWTQVSGPTTPLGGATTPTLGVAPTDLGTYVFRLAVGNQPITVLNPGLYFTDVVLTLD
jgi:hypothetical protein